MDMEFSAFAISSYTIMLSSVDNIMFVNYVKMFKLYTTNNGNIKFP